MLKLKQQIDYLRNLNVRTDTFTNSKRILITVNLIAIYFLIYSLLEFKYIYDIYSCERLNLCIYGEIFFSKFQIYFLQIIKIFSVIFLFVPKLRKLSLVTLLLTQVLFMFANKHLHSPEQAYLNFLILILINVKIPNSFKDEQDLSQNMNFIWLYNIVFFIGYSYSGFTKYQSSPWMSGDFMITFFKTNHLVFSEYIYDTVNTNLLRFLTYFVVFIELFSFLSLFNRLLKVFFITSLSLMQLGLLLTTDLWQVSLGMLICHFFVIDQNFLRFYQILFLKFLNIKKVIKH